jgi:integrase
VAALTAAGVRAATVGASFRLLRRVLSAAEAAGMVTKNPARGVKVPPSPREEMRFLSPGELLAVAEAVEERDRALVLLLGLCGLRIGEALALTVDDLDLLRRRVRITKAGSEVRGKVIIGPHQDGRCPGGRPASNVVDEFASTWQRSLRAPPALYSLIATEARFAGQLATASLKRAGIAERFPRVHDLRHTAVALAIGEGGHPKSIQAMLGHSSITVTLDRYGHLFPSIGERLADALDARIRRADVDQVWTKRGPAAIEDSA